MSDPLEDQFTALLNTSGIEFTRPEHEPADPTNLDFHLSRLDLYVEVKAYHTDWITRQLALIPQGGSAMILIGRDSIDKFVALVRLIQSVG